jgi:serine/threonine protein kinase
MALSTARWRSITDSEFAWERAALDFVRERLPDAEPYRAWSNFDFIADDGTINEVDLVVLAPSGFFLIEIKSRPGLLEGDAHTWTWTTEGRKYTYDNPLLLANRKAKRLASLLKHQKALTKGWTPYLEAVVYCSAMGVDARLQGATSGRVYFSDPTKPGIVDLLSSPSSDKDPRSQNRIDYRMAKAVSQAMEQAGIKPSQRWRRVGDYTLEELLREGPAYQDWRASHVTLANVQRRVHLYPLSAAATKDVRVRLRRAAEREFRMLEGVNHPGILRATDFKEHERGPALFFEYFQGAIRLDHYLKQYGTTASVDLRLNLLRQISDAIRYAHEKKIVHRALSPQAVLVVDPESKRPTVRIFDWQTGYREAMTEAASGQSVSPTAHVGDLVEDAATAYLAPETFTDPTGGNEQSDIFSLGAIAYHLFSGQPPAESQIELHKKLRDNAGLRISAVTDGASENLEILIEASTSPAASNRPSSVADFLRMLDDVEEELTRPDRGDRKDPADAGSGDDLEHGFTVKQRLGHGACSVTLLVGRDGKESVLKVASEPDDNEILRAEGEVLKKCRHQSIVQLHDILEFGDRVGLNMARAGEQTLGQRLRHEGKLHIDLLQRLGEDLLEAVDWLEQNGIPHRDLKPDNMGVGPIGKDKKLHLVLFDFSLSRTPLDRIHAGTRPYLDPFLTLRNPPQWDTYAERFAAAMTLHEMAAGTLPKWGDGHSDPALLECEVTLDTERFEPNLREGLTRFFEKALKRKYNERFDNAEEMLRAWRQVFEAADSKTPVTEEYKPEELEAALVEATPESRLPLLPLSTRALNALERLGLNTVRDLLAVPVFRLHRLPGVGNKTRREIGRVVGILSKRLAAETQAAILREGATEGTDEEPGFVSLDLLARQILPTRRRAEAPGEDRILRQLLGLDETGVASGWTSQSDVATRIGVTRARVGQILADQRARWAKLKTLTQLRHQISQMLDKQGGVMGSEELANALLASRGSAQGELTRSVVANAVLRAAVETERALAEPAFVVQRSGDRVLIASSSAHADYAERLGREADRLSDADPIASPIRVVDTLQKVPGPAGVALSTERLVTLAVAASTRAALSSRLEIFPRKMDALRTLKLASGALLGIRELTVAEIRERVSSRYPGSEPLPGPPRLGDLLEEAGLELDWSPTAAGGLGAFRHRRHDFPSGSSSSSSLTRQETTHEPAVDAAPEITDARYVEERLMRAQREGAFLVLLVPPRYLLRAERELVTRFDVDQFSLEQVLVRQLHAEADGIGASWQTVLRADSAAHDSADWRNLMTLVRQAVPRVQGELVPRARTILVVNSGILARYGQLSLLEWLRDRVGRPGGLFGAWILVPADASSAMPSIDGEPIPVITRAEWLWLPDAWLANRHRSNPETQSA